MKVVADPGVAALIAEFAVVVGVAGSCDVLQQLLVLLSNENEENVKAYVDSTSKS